MEDQLSNNSANDNNFEDVNMGGSSFYSQSFINKLKNDSTNAGFDQSEVRINVQVK